MFYVITGWNKSESISCRLSRPKKRLSDVEIKLIFCLKAEFVKDIACLIVVHIVFFSRLF